MKMSKANGGRFCFAFAYRGVCWLTSSFHVPALRETVMGASSWDKLLTFLREERGYVLLPWRLSRLV